MAVYPDIITGVQSTTPLQWASNFRVISTQFENGQEVRRLIDGYARRSVKVLYKPVTFAQANTLRRFYEARRGPYESFFFIFPQLETFSKELVSTIRVAIPGNATLLKPPSMNAQSYTLYRNNSVESSGNYTFTPASSAPSGEDTISLNYTPNAGDVFTFSFTGRLKITARFSKRPIVVSDVKDLYSYIEIELEGIYPEESTG